MNYERFTLRKLRDIAFQRSQFYLSCLDESMNEQKKKKKQNKNKNRMMNKKGNI